MEQNNQNYGMEQILKASFGESNNEIKVSFKKTILKRQYETEVVEIESKLNVDKELDGATRQLLCTILQAQVEYTTYSQLMYKKELSLEEVQSRKAYLERSVKEAIYRYEKTTGKSASEYLDQG